MALFSFRYSLIIFKISKRCLITSASVKKRPRFVECLPAFCCISLSNFCNYPEVVTALLSSSRMKFYRNWEHLKSVLADRLKKRSLVCELGPLLLPHPLPSICPWSAMSLSIQRVGFFILNSVRIFFFFWAGTVCRRIYNTVDYFRTGPKTT